MNPSATSTPSCSFKRAESDSVVVDVSRRQIRNSKAETNEVISKRHSGAQLGASCFGRGCCGRDVPRPGALMYIAVGATCLHHLADSKTLSRITSLVFHNRAMVIARGRSTRGMISTKNQKFPRSLKIVIKAWACGGKCCQRLSAR